MIFQLDFGGRSIAGRSSISYPNEKAPTAITDDPLPETDRKTEGTFCFIVYKREAQPYGSNYTGFPAVNRFFLQSGLSISYYEHFSVMSTVSFTDALLA